MNDADLDLIERSLGDATDNVCDTMLGGFLAHSPAAAPAAAPLVGRIHVSGDLGFTVELELPEDAAVALAGSLLGVAPDPADPMVEDAFGEFTNMVVGGAKARLAGHTCRLSVPGVARGGADAGETLRTLVPRPGLRIRVLPLAAA